MKKTILIYGLLLAAGTFLLKSIEYYYMVRMFPVEIYVTLVAVGFAALGIWLGAKITTPRSPADRSFTRNIKAIESLQISDRELEVLDLLAKGLSNSEIAGQLFISVNTVKTHLSHIYQKLDVGRRSKAVRKAKLLKMIP